MPFTYINGLHLKVKFANQAIQGISSLNVTQIIPFKDWETLGMFFSMSVFYALQSLGGISLLEYEGLKYGKLHLFLYETLLLKKLRKFHISYFLLIRPTSESYKQHIRNKTLPSPSSENIT